jgi:molecular chaperone HscB
MADYFSFLGVPRRLRLDEGDLERRYRALSREFHPDYFHNAPAAEKRRSLEQSSYLNDAYRTLRDPVSRMTYLLELETGNEVAGDGGDRVPAVLLEEVFALNEELDDIRALKARGVPEREWRMRLERARRPVEARRVDHEADLASLAERWDAMAVREDAQPERQQVLTTLRGRLRERNYIVNLLAVIDRSLNEGFDSQDV